MPILSGRKLAAELNVSHTAVNRASEAGRITREPCGGFDLDKCRVQWNENVNIHQQARANASRKVEQVEPVVPPAEETQLPCDESEFSRARLQREIELEKLVAARRENAKAEQRLVDRAEVVRVFQGIGKIYARGREALPVELAPLLVGKNPYEIEELIRTALTELDIRISNEIADRFSRTIDDVSTAAA